MLLIAESLPLAIIWFGSPMELHPIHPRVLVDGQVAQPHHAVLDLHLCVQLRSWVTNPVKQLLMLSLKI